MLIDVFIFSYTPTLSNRSLYEELRATSSLPAFSLETSSEFMKFENMKMESESDESKSEESIDESFRKDKLGFKNNVTKQEHHSIDEALFDGESIKYSSIILNRTKPDEEVETTALPAVLTTVKKAKQLDLTTRDGENFNASIPSNAEVWALAGMRKGETKSNGSNSEVELLSGGLNNTAKNLLDWTEIAKMNNESIMQDGDEKEILRQTTVMNDLDDPATSENKDASVFVISRRPATTSKTAIDDNRIELENGNIDFGAFNKSSAAKSNVDADVFSANNPEEKVEIVELIDPFKKSVHDGISTKQNLRIAETELKNIVLATTEPADNFTTDSSEMVEATTTEVYETTTSFVDSFTVIGEDEENEDVFKRTITELPPATTDEPAIIAKTTQAPPTTAHSETMITEMTSQSMNEIPDSTQRYNKSTKSIRATTTETPERMGTTLIDNETIFSTFIPKYTSSSQSTATTQQYGVPVDSSSSPTEIVDDDKFKYGTLLPDASTMSVESIGVDKLDESTRKMIDSLNKESLDGGDTGNSNLVIISASVSGVVILVLIGVAFVSFKIDQT